MKPPEEVKLSREGGEALIERIKASNLGSEDQGLLVQLIRVYFWLTLALQETKISLKRLRVALFGEGRKKPTPPGAGRGGSRLVARQLQPRPSPPRGLRRLSRVRRKRVLNGVVATAAGGLRRIRALKRSYAAMMPWRWVNVVRHVAAAPYTRCPRGSRSGSTATRCSRRCVMRWSDCAVPPVARCSRPPCRCMPGKRNIQRGRARCWRCPGIRWGCRFTGWRGFKCW
jgi:hypothetical protein